MALDNRSIVITLKLDSGQGSDVNSNPANTEAKQQESNKGGTAKAVAAFAVTQAAQLAVNEVVAWGEYYWNRELTLDDDYIGQRNKSVALTQINRAISAISTVGSMTAAGASVGGAAGAAVGAILGVITAGAGIVRSNVQGADQQNIAIRQLDAQLQYTRSRAGWSTKAASIGENL